MQPRFSRIIEPLSHRGVSLCRSESAIEINGQVFKPDQSTAYVEFYLSHAFPVVTCDGTGLHPQVVANSYLSMLYKVFDLAHIMRKYDPKNNPRDRMLGTIVAVEFPSIATVSSMTPEGGWTVQSSKDSAPGIRAVAVMHKAAEQVDQILAKYFSGEMNWTVSMEQDYIFEEAGFLVKLARGEVAQNIEDATPEDLRALGYSYIPVTSAPQSLLDCFNLDESKITKKWQGAETVILFGGLNGQVHYKGVGLTPLGKEKEAEVSQMLAAPKLIEVNGVLMPDFIGLIAATAQFSK